ncbi:NAD(P)-dependent oxidoreductase [Clostridiaceae bacterium UIB06]|uniref:precorrin-2 dehydrogenase n=1 Tax=Clostridium thailandense TaxID=2794346 RepID=A0A949TZ04_9CLOT|nr:NAD(P)-dependent oxidoreductase [Clostridium thailandense]MBV7275243.1 NAD(P)-dependent oxidoreductase [Clostridium thailandense]MCH5137754.1 NAD(P)-dependent oxidoreductase [Clostridiaceae bacterium UIB06]
MYEDNKEDILCSGIDHTMISLISHKINLLIVGGGRAALIKAKTFIQRGCSSVSVVSKEFLPEFEELEHYSNLKLIKEEYKKLYIKDKHIIAIATNCEEVNKKVRKDCDELSKLYIDCTNPKEGLCIMACQRSTKSTSFGINTNDISPKTSVFLANKIKDKLEKYDNFISFTALIRNKAKELKNKNEIMGFICSDDFLFFYEIGLGELILKMFYPDVELFKE